jgi:hypothetical protein
MQASMAPISANLPKRKELTPYERGQIIGATKCSVDPSKISEDLNVPKSTVRSTLLRVPLRKHVASRPRSGRPKTYMDCEERLLLRVVRQFPNMPSYVHSLASNYAPLPLGQFYENNILQLSV